VCRLRYIVRQIARHFPAAERPAVDAWFHDGFLAHMSVPFWDSLGVPFGPNALHALVAVKEFESVLEQVKAGSIRSPSQLVRPLSLSLGPFALALAQCSTRLTFSPFDSLRSGRRHTSPRCTGS